MNVVNTVLNVAKATFTALRSRRWQPRQRGTDSALVLFGCRPAWSEPSTSHRLKPDRSSETSAASPPRRHEPCMSASSQVTTSCRSSRCTWRPRHRLTERVRRATLGVRTLAPDRCEGLQPGEVTAGIARRLVRCRSCEAVSSRQNPAHIIYNNIYHGSRGCGCSRSGHTQSQYRRMPAWFSYLRRGRGPHYHPSGPHCAPPAAARCGTARAARGSGPLTAGLRHRPPVTRF